MGKKETIYTVERQGEREKRMKEEEEKRSKKGRVFTMGSEEQGKVKKNERGKG